MVARNIGPMLRHYGRDLLLRNKPPHRIFWRTPFMFRAVNKLMSELIDPSEYAFSFQMQSIFAGKVPGLPHFVYTDHTYLENFRYPGS